MYHATDVSHTRRKMYMLQLLPSHSQLEEPKGHGFSYGSARERVMIHCGRASAWTQSLIAWLSSPRYSGVTLGLE